MALIKYYVNGVGGSTGADLATVSPLYTSGTVYYLGNATTGNSDANAGTDRVAPLATLAHAYAVAAAGDIIDVLAGHSETLGSIVWAKAGLRLVGEGAGALVPRFVGSTSLSIEVTAAGCMFDNLQFGPTTFAGGITLQLEASNARCNNLSFVTGANETSSCFGMTGAGSAQNARITNCTFTSGSKLSYAIELSSTWTDVTMENVVLDGSSFGWATYAWRNDATITRLCITGLQLLNGSDVLIGTGTTGYIQVSEQSGSSQIDWTP